MAKPFKLAIVSDVREVVRGNEQVERSFEDVADALDGLATESRRAGDDIRDGIGDGAEDAAGKVKDAGKDIDKALETAGDGAKDAGDDIRKHVTDGAEDAGKAAGDLEVKFRDATDALSSGAKTKAGEFARHTRAGMDDAGEATETFKDEARSNLSETFSSFDGSVDGLVDGLQGTFGGVAADLGPAGMIGGAVVAAGIGLAVSYGEKLAEEIAARKEEVIALAEQMREVNGDPRAIDWAERLAEKLGEIVDERSWYEFWQDEPTTALEDWARKADDFGLTWKDFAQSMAGENEAAVRSLQEIDDQLATTEQAMRFAATQEGTSNSERYNTLTALERQQTGLEGLREELVANAGLTEEAAAANELYAGAIEGLDEKTREALESQEAYRDGVVDALTGAGEAWEEYTEDGKTNLAEYNKAIEEQLAAVQGFEANLVTASKVMSEEALNYIRALGPEAAPLLQAFVDAPLAEQQRTAANWDVLGKAATDGYEGGMDLPGATARERNAAQEYANRNPVRVPLELMSEQLQAMYDTAISRVNPGRIPVWADPQPWVY